MNRWVRILLFSLVGIGLLFVGIGFSLYVPDIPPEVLNEKYGVRPSDYIRVKGMDVHYRIEGRMDDPLPLVLLHGTSSSLYTWNGWTQLLDKKHKIIRLDLPAFGLTGPHPEQNYSLDFYINFLQEFLSKLGVEQCVMAGNSLGGELAWRYALQNPEQVKALVLIGAAGYPIEVDELPLMKVPLSYMGLRIPLLRELSVKFTPPQVIRGSLEFLYGDADKVSEELVELYFDMTAREGNREALTERMEYFGEPSPIENIPDISIPTLILWGGKDRLIPVENAGRFYRDLPIRTLYVLPDAGHMPMEEAPGETAGVLEEFLKSISIVPEKPLSTSL